MPPLRRMGKVFPTQLGWQSYVLGAGKEINFGQVPASLVKRSSGCRGERVRSSEKGRKGRPYIGNSIQGVGVTGEKGDKKKKKN